MKIAIPLSLIAALAVTAPRAEEEKPVEEAAPTIDAVTSNTETVPASEPDAASQAASSQSEETPAKESAPPEVVSESQE